MGKEVEEQEEEEESGGLVAVMLKYSLPAASWDTWRGEMGVMPFSHELLRCPRGEREGQTLQIVQTVSVLLSFMLITHTLHTRHQLNLKEPPLVGVFHPTCCLIKQNLKYSLSESYFRSMFCYKKKIYREKMDLLCGVRFSTPSLTHIWSLPTCM